MKQEQITSLQSHRLEVEKTITQQSNLVQRLELKLKEAEDAIQNHMETQKSNKPIIKMTSSSSTSAPQSPIQRKRNLEKEYNSKKYQPTPKPNTAKSRLRWDDGYSNGNSYHNKHFQVNSESSSGEMDEKDYDEYEDETSRYGDLTYENREISDEDEEIIPLKYSKSYPSQRKRSSGNSNNNNMNNRWAVSTSNPSLQVVSILKDVLINLMNKDSNNDLPMSSSSSRSKVINFFIYIFIQYLSIY